MSLMFVVIAVLIMEYTLWFYASHSAAEPIERTYNLMYISICSAGLAAFYVTSWSNLGRTQFVDPSPIMYFALINIAVAVVAAIAIGASRLHKK